VDAQPRQPLFLDTGTELTTMEKMQLWNTHNSASPEVGVEPPDDRLDVSDDEEEPFAPYITQARPFLVETKF
jgi:hypothetical protein